MSVNDAMASFTDARCGFMSDAGKLRAASFWYNPANILPKLALGKLHVERVDSFTHVYDSSGVRRIMPSGDRDQYYGGLLMLGSVSTLALVPGWVADHAKKTYKVQLQQREYFYPSGKVRNHEGPEFRQVRQHMRKAERQCAVETYTQQQSQDYLAINKSWYKNAAARYFRTYDKTCIDWLLGNWNLARSYAPDLVCLGARDIATGSLLSFRIGSDLTTESWVTYTYRYDPSSKLHGTRDLLITQMNEGFPNRVSAAAGTADSKEVREMKEKYTKTTIPFYTMGKK